jgi:glycerophosphoryl diester phosphodiesterase
MADEDDGENRQNRRLMTVLLGVLSLPLLFFAATLIGGALSPREHTVSESALIDASREQVFTAISDVGSFVEWRSELEGVELLTGAGHERWRERADGEQVTYEVVESEAPSRLVTRIADDELPWGGTWTYALEAEGEQTRVTIREDGWVDNLVFRFFARFVFGYESTIEAYLADLAEYAPSVTVPAAAEEAPPPRSIDVQGHRGVRGHVPENTLAGFRRALAIGVTTLEMDLALTADDVVVVHHDETLNVDIARGEDGEWIDASRAVPIRSQTHAALTAFDVGRLRPGSEYAARFSEQQPVDGERIPTLAEVISMADGVSGGRIRYNLELKRTPSEPERTADPETFARAALAAVDEAGARDRTTFQSFDFACIDALAALDDALELACLTTEEEDPGSWLGGRDLADFDGSVVRLVQSTACKIWSPHFDGLDAEAVEEAHRANLRVIPWTVNEPDQIARAYDLGVDGIISDHPDRVRAFLESRGAPLPPAFSEAPR